MYSSAFRVLVLARPWVSEGFLPGVDNHGIILFYHLKNNKKTFFYKQIDRKVLNFKIQGAQKTITLLPFQRPWARPNMKILYLCTVSANQEHQLLQSFQYNFFILWWFKQINKKIPITEICFDRHSDTILLKESYPSLPLKIWFCKLRSWWNLNRFHL